MATTLTPETIESINEAVQKKYDPRKAPSDISLDLQEYKYASRFLEKAKTARMGGKNVNWKLKVRHNDNFQWTGLYHVDVVNRVEFLEEATAPWAMSTVTQHYDRDEEAFTQGEEAIIDYFREFNRDLLVDYYKNMEDTILGSGPTASTDSPMTPYTLRWWLQLNATQGFNGGNPSGFSSGPGGINTSTYPNWKNRTFSYAAITKDDLITKASTAVDLCYFKPPVAGNDALSAMPNWEILTTYSRFAELNRLLESQNDNLGLDLVAYMGKASIRSVPIDWVPAWTNTSSVNAQTNGLFMGINWNTFDFYRHPQRQMRRQSFQDPLRSNVQVNKIDDTCQLVCNNRRANFVGYSTVTVTEIN